MTSSSEASEFKSRLRRTLGAFATGVTVITTHHTHDERQVGLTVNSFSSVSLDPPMVLWSLGHHSPNRDAFEVGSCNVIHVLRADQADVATHFATPSDNKFETMDMTRDDETGAPILSDWSALLRCKTTALIPAGDHDIVLSEVLDFAHRPSQPLLFVHGQFASLASEPASVG